MEHICTCNHCGGLFIDTNPQTNAKKFEVDYLDLVELIDHKCTTCENDASLDDNVSHKLWDILGNTVINNEGELLESFLHFDITTDREDIWHWFEETFNLSVAEDLMYVK